MNEVASIYEMSLEHEIPVLMKKTQMSGDRGSQCGLTSLLPMSCRGRAAAFARDLHSRLRNLGASPEGDDETLWITRNANTHLPSNGTQRDLDTFYDFELECESPSSPVDEFDPPFSDRSPTEEQESFYDVDSDPDVKEQPKSSPELPDKAKNGFRFATSFYTDSSPVKLQPVPRENGHVDKPLYSAITFDGIARQNSRDEINSEIESPSVLHHINNVETDCLSLPNHLNLTFDSDSEFESAKSDPSDGLEVVQSKDNVETGSVEDVESSIITENENCLDGESFLEPVSTVTSEISENIDIEAPESTKLTLEIITNEVDEKEVSLVPEIETNHLTDENNEDEQDEDDRPQRVRRCSSLKTGKTPPGTPGRKKIVRFADVLGLDLADVKTFMDEIPVIPKSAYDDLTGCDIQNSPPVRSIPRIGTLSLVPLFQLPRDLTDKLEKLNVCLESARVCEGVHVTICGSVRVRNLDFNKSVHVRYTMNRWKTFTDLQTAYVQGSCDGYSDRFQFTLYAPCISSGQRLELAVRFQCKGQQFWDNNSGTNYCFDCLALGTTHPTAPSSGPLHPTVDWHPSFY